MTRASFPAMKRGQRSGSTWAWAGNGGPHGGGGDRERQGTKHHGGSPRKRRPDGALTTT